jgi:xanthine phosphoribosyltransferase
MSKVIEQLAWDNIHQGIDKLVEVLRGDAYVPDVVITIGRGGLIPGALLTYRFNVKTVHNFSVQTYNDNDVKTHAIICTQEPGRSLEIKHRDSKVLVVDDISDSGHTLEYIKNELSTNYGLNNIKFATLYTKKSTSFTPDYFVTEFPDESWVVFPWE